MPGPVLNAADTLGQRRQPFGPHGTLVATNAVENKTDKALQLHEASILVGGNTIKPVVIKHVYSTYSIL